MWLRVTSSPKASRFPSPVKELGDIAAVKNALNELQIVAQDLKKTTNRLAMQVDALKEDRKGRVNVTNS